MLRSTKDLIHSRYTLKALDGNIGRCTDLLFDDEKWAVRYLVARTGKWLEHKEVVISPISLEAPDGQNMVFPVQLTRKQIEGAPSLDVHQPISRLHEREWAEYFNYGSYWLGPGTWGAAGYPAALRAPQADAQSDSAEGRNGSVEERHLRSVDEVSGYHIHAMDGPIGHVEEFILATDTWDLRYLIVDTRNWLPGRRVLVSPQWVSKVSWVEHEVAIDLSKSQVRESPEYDPSRPINRAFELRLYDYYGRPVYW